MKIALITDGITPYVMGGMQRHSFHLVRTLAGMGVEIDLYHTDKGTGEDIHRFAGMNDSVRKNINSIFINWPTSDQLPGHYLRQLSEYSRSAYSAYQSRTKPDFIYTKGLTGSAFLKAKASGVSLPPIGNKAHGYEMFQIPPSPKLRLQHYMLRPTFRRQAKMADVIFSYGGKITEIIENKLGVKKEQIEEIPSGVPQSWICEKPSPVGKVIEFVFIGRYERRKGIEELISVIASNEEWGKKARFKFIGPIPKDKHLSMPHVSFLGSIREPEVLKQELQASDVLICPSYSEGMPNVILEGMAQGLAVIASDVGAINSLVIPGETGWLLAPGDKNALCQAIEGVLHLTQSEIEMLKCHSPLRIRQHFTWEEVGKLTYQAIRKRISLE